MTDGGIGFGTMWTTFGNVVRLLTTGARYPQGIFAIFTISCLFETMSILLVVFAEFFPLVNKA